ncbi:MAG: hypothetical protein HY765_07940 [Rhodomicrobium sp.]|nr:hypothetical protein [Rhodomicrobium sp.]
MIRLAVFGAIFFASALTTAQARKEGVSLSGSWRGGGTVLYSSGQRERARCRAHFSQSDGRVSLNAVCATPSGSVSQTASLRRVGANRYAGSFFNPQYNVSGSIYIVVRGNTQSVTLRSGNGSASLVLRH